MHLKILNIVTIKVFLLILASIFLSSCSSICSIKETAELVSVVTHVRHNHRSTWDKVNDEKLKSCVVNSSYRYAEGGVLGDFIPSFSINGAPSCLLKKAKIESLKDKTLVVIEDSYTHFEAGFQYTVSTFKCPDNISFSE